MNKLLIVYITPGKVMNYCVNKEDLGYDDLRRLRLSHMNFLDELGEESPKFTSEFISKLEALPSQPLEGYGEVIITGCVL